MKEAGRGRDEGGRKWKGRRRQEGEGVKEAGRGMGEGGRKGKG